MSEKLIVYCTQCGAEIRILPAHIGREVRCAHCGRTTLLTFDAPESAADSAANFDEESDELESRPIRFKRRNTTADDMDMTPMVDVTFLLLIFFMVTAAFALQRSLEIPPPDSDKNAAQEQIQEDPDEQNSIIVRIMRDNSVFVEDHAAPSRQELLAVLRNAVQPQGDMPAPDTLIVLADSQALHETVVMVLDAGNAVGMKNIRLKMEDQE